MPAWNLDGCCDLLEAADDTLRPGGVELTARLLELGAFSDGSRLLDAGCGTGASMRYLAGTGRLQAVGVDDSPTLLQAAHGRSPELPLVRASLERLPFARGSFDGVLCECVLSQTQADAVLAEFGRVLRPGGLLLISDLYRKKQPADSGGKAADDDQPSAAQKSSIAPSTLGEPAATQTLGEPLATREQLTARLFEAGFSVGHWEDRSDALRALAMRLIMAPGPAAADPFGWSNHRDCMREKGTKSRWKDVGYHLVVARRMTR